MKIKLPSVREIAGKTVAVINRFPLISIFLLIGFGLSLYLSFDKTSLDSIEQRSPQFLLSLMLTIFLLFPARVAIENGAIQGKRARWIEPLLMVPGIILYWSLPQDSDNMSLLHATRVGMILLSALFLIFLFAKDSLKSDESLWNWHGSLVPAIARGFLYTFIIQLGIGAAFGAIDYLFGTKLIEHSYLRINLFLFWLTAPLIILHSIPRGGEGSEPIDLNSFLIQIPRFLLFPLTVIYLLILYAYGIRILFAMDLPKGMVSHLVLGFAGFGLITFWTLIPFLREEKYRWIEKARTGFFVLQIPLVVLLFFGIGRRISDYGWTFQRYLIVELAIWLAIVAVLAIILRKISYRWIIGSLAIVSLITVVGPINAYTVTLKNQKQRLTAILDQGGMLKDGKLCKATGTLSDSLKSEVGSIIHYLDDYGLTRNLNSMNPDTGDLSESKIIEITGMVFPYNRYSSATSSNTFSYYSQNGGNRCDTLPDGTRILTIYFNPGSEVMLTDSLLKSYHCSSGGRISMISRSGDTLTISLAKYAKELKMKSESSRNFAWSEKGNNLTAQILVTSIGGNYEGNDSAAITYGTFTFLVRSDSKGVKNKR